VHPVILQIGPLTIHSYGVLFALSFAMGILLAVTRCRGRGVSTEEMTDLALVILVSAIVGSRALFVIPHWSDFAGDPLSAFKIWEGGLTLYGGVILAAIGSWVFVSRRRLPWPSVTDAVAPSLALGLGLTRIGCFLNGCCYGIPTTGPFGVRYPPKAAASVAFPDAALLPTQLFESAFGFLLFGVLLAIDRRRPREGLLILVLVIAYGAFRFAIDFARCYEEAMRVPIGGLGSLTVNQLVSLSGVLLGVAGLLARRAAGRASAVAPADARREA
jgi:phosphatidylglycerol:prolipoprotein diacylglycerol transferase